MRIIPAVTVLLLLAIPAHADPCGELADKVAGAAKAEVSQRSGDFVNFAAGDGVTLTLSCGDHYPSSVGAQYRGETPPESYVSSFVEAGHAVTGIAADILRDATHRARADAARLRHSNVEAGGALVTCSFTRSEKGSLTMCAVIERADRS